MEKYNMVSKEALLHQIDCMKEHLDEVNKRILFLTERVERLENDQAIARSIH